MNAAKVTLTSTVLAAAFGLVLGLSAVPSDSYACNTGENHKTGEACGGGGGGNVTNPDDFENVPCGDLFDLNGGNCKIDMSDDECGFDVNVGVVNGNPVMKISLVEDCTTDTMLVLPNFLDPSDPNFPSFFDNCDDVSKICPSSDTNTFLDGRDFVLTAVNGPGPIAFSGDAVITNSTDHGEIVDITIAIQATSAGCGGSPKSAINIDLDGAPALHAPPRTHLDSYPRNHC